MQAADLRNRDDLAALRWFDFSLDRGVTIQGQVRPRVEIVVEVRSEDALEMTFVEKDYMIVEFWPDL